MKFQLILVISALLVISPFLAFADTASVTINGVEQTFDYTGTGVSISSVDYDMDFTSLILSVGTESNSGTLEVTFDRTFFDSELNGSDVPFIILADGDEATFEETGTTDTSRTLKIDVPTGTEEIEIIGTMISAQDTIPETTIPETTIPETTIPETTIPETTTPETTTPETTTPETTTEKPTEKPTTKPDTPKIVCGEGTVLKDGLCVLDKTCGEGTILKDGLCVVAPIEEPETTSKGLGYQGMVGIIAGFVVAGVIAGVLALISKGSKSKN